MTKLIHHFLKDESGATAIEYTLIVALIAMAIIGILTTVGTSLKGGFETLEGKITAAP